MKRVFFLIIAMVTVSALSNIAEARWNGFGNRWDNGKRNRCVFELQTRRGRTIETFRARECRKAKRECRQEKRWRQNRGRNPHARCVKVSGGYDSGYDYSTWVCTGRDSGWEEHFGGHQAVGRTYREAYRKALRKCEREHGSCNVSCEQR